MRKYLLAIFVLVLLSAGVVVGLLLVQQNAIFKQKAATPTGTATVSITPATATVERNTPNTVNINFNTHGVSVSAVQVVLTYSNLGITYSPVTINPDLLSSGGWGCPAKSISSAGSVDTVTILCAVLSPGGYSNTTDTLLASFNLTASQVPLQNPLIVSFDPELTKITQFSDATDIALTPTGTGSYTITDTIAQSPTESPIVIVPSPTATAEGATPTPTATATAEPTATPTPTPTATGSSNNATATPTATATSTTTANGTTSPTNPPIPVTGFDAPTIIGGAAGVILLLLGAVLVF